MHTRPLQGTEQPPRGLFLDRWGTLLIEPESGLAEAKHGVRFHEGALEALFRVHRAGWYIYLVGNEDDVAFGKVSDQDWLEIQNDYQKAIHAAGIRLRRDYVCLDHPEGVGGHENDSVYRLPNTGILYHALNSDNIDLSKSWVVGDSTLELASGWRAGCHMGGVSTGLGLSDGTFQLEPEFMAADLSEALQILLQAGNVHPTLAA